MDACCGCWGRLVVGRSDGRETDGKTGKRKRRGRQGTRRCYVPGTRRSTYNSCISSVPELYSYMVTVLAVYICTWLSSRLHVLFYFLLVHAGKGRPHRIGYLSPELRGSLLSAFPTLAMDNNCKRGSVFLSSLVLFTGQCQ